MKQAERELLHNLILCRVDIPYPREILTSPISGYQSYTQDMRTFNQAADELTLGLLYPHLVGDGYAPPKKVLQGIQAWIKRRKAAEWEFNRDEIAY